MTMNLLLRVCLFVCGAEERGRCGRRGVVVFRRDDSSPLPPSSWFSGSSSTISTCGPPHARRYQQSEEAIVLFLVFFFQCPPASAVVLGALRLRAMDDLCFLLWIKVFFFLKKKKKKQSSVCACQIQRRTIATWGPSFFGSKRARLCESLV